MPILKIILRFVRISILKLRSRIFGVPAISSYAPLKSGHRAKRPEKGRGLPPTRLGRVRPVSGRSYLDRFGVATAKPDHPILDKLSRRAINDIFDWLDLPLIPGQIWPILEKVGDPGLAVERLVEALGCEPSRVRQRDSEELARFEAAIELLAALDILRPHIREIQIIEIECILLSGKRDTIHTYGRIISNVSSVFVGKEKSSSLRGFASYGLFLKSIEKYFSNPLDLTIDESEEALQISDNFVGGMERYSDYHKSITEAIRLVFAHWPDGVADDRVHLRDGMTLRFEQIDEDLLNDLTLNLDQISDLLDETRALLTDINDLFDAICGSRRGGKPDGMSETDEALKFFGFEPGSKPMWAEITRAWKVVHRKAHPDRGAGLDPTERAKREEETKKANIYRDHLRRSGFAAA